MKFKYTGQLPIKDGDLVLGKVFKANEVITKGTVFEIPNDNTLLIQRVKMSGIYEEFVEPKKIIRPKKEIKKDKDEEEK